MKKKIAILFVLFAFATVAIAFAPEKKTLKNDKTKSSISYHCKHPLHEWTGINKNINCFLINDDSLNKIIQVAVICNVVDFDSDDSNRDSHGMEVLEGIKYPRLMFSSTNIIATDDKLKVTGNLTFHGVTKPITFDAIREDKDKQIVVKGNFSILLSDYKIERPSFMLVQMEDKADITFYMVFNK